jgi:hypothetical protein
MNKAKMKYLQSKANNYLDVGKEEKNSVNLLRGLQQMKISALLNQKGLTRKQKELRDKKVKQLRQEMSINVTALNINKKDFGNRLGLPQYKQFNIRYVKVSDALAAIYGIN